MNRSLTPIRLTMCFPMEWFTAFKHVSSEHETIGGRTNETATKQQQLFPAAFMQQHGADPYSRSKDIPAATAADMIPFSVVENTGFSTHDTLLFVTHFAQTVIHALHNNKNQDAFCQKVPNTALTDIWISKDKATFLLISLLQTGDIEIQVTVTWISCWWT